jgi:Bacterial lectin/Galactose oxidase-like, Early set domain
MGITATSDVWSVNYWETDAVAGIEDVDFSAPSDSSSSQSGAIAEFALNDSVTEPGPGLGYAAEYASTVTVDSSETITFYLAAAGDADLIINGENVLALRCENIEGAQEGPCPQNGASVCLCSAESPFEQGSFTIELGPGTHTIELQHFDHATGKSVVLDWAVGGLPRQPMDLEPPTAAVAPVSDDDGGGEWGGVLDWPLIGLHAILTPDNKLLTYGTDQNGVQGGQLIYDVWDYKTGEHTTLANTTSTDLFCSVPILVPSTGEILISGGDARPLGGYNLGVNDVNVYNYQDMSLTPSPTGDMAYQRWYPTAVTLANGKILMVGGKDGAGNGVGMPELYTPGVGWKSLTGAYSGTIAQEWWYPRTWLNSDGNVVMFGTAGGIAGPDAYDVFLMDPSGDGSIQKVATLPFQAHRSLPAVMFEQDKVLLLGADGSTWIMDISGDDPSFTRTANVGADRLWSDLVVLADGSVMVSGGSRVDNELVGVSKDVGIWDPNTGQWKWGDSEDIARLYHSTTILLPDATILSLGGGAPGPLNNTNGEIYTPPYLFDENGDLAERPVIIDAPTDIDQRESFTITVDDAGSIERLTLVKAGSVTHSLNMTTTKLELDFSVGPGNTLDVSPSLNSNVLSPGQWMLFAFDSNGTPSVAATLQVGLGGEAYSEDFGGYITLNGTASFDEDNGVYTLTNDAKNQVGAVFSNDRLDLKDDFDISFEVFLGDSDAGADGMALVFHNAPFGADSIGGGGGNLGAFGISDGLALEFDTHNNNGNPALGDIANDHSSWIDTDTGTITGGSGALDHGNIEDNDWHTVSVSWDADSQTLQYVFDGQPGATLSGDLASLYFGGSSFVTFGFTAATGGRTSQHQVRALDVQGTIANPTAVEEGLDTVANMGGDVVLKGAASHIASTGVVTLTADANGLVGGVMSNQRINLNADFDISFNVFLGSKDGGADGMAFVLHDSPFGADALGGGGSNLGAIGISDGLALEFDSHYSKGLPQYGDIAADHTAWIDTDTGAIAPGSGPLNHGNIEDGDWHSVSVSWDADSQTLSYVFDGQQGTTLSGDLASQYFDGSDHVYFGFTGATGGLSNLQQVQVLDLDATFEGSDPPPPDDDDDDPVDPPPEYIDTVVTMGGDVVMTGNAVHSSTTGLITLTADAQYQLGAAMSNQRIDLNDDFNFSFRVFTGFGGVGADGMAFVLHSSPDGADSIGGGGGNLGAFGISDGLALEFDTHNNKGNPAFGDIANDHSAWVDTDTGTIAAGSGTLNLGEIEDGDWHSVSVSWDAQAQTLSYVFDGQQGATLSGNLAYQYFGGSEFVYFGFTGATGGKTNLQQVQAVELEATLVGPAPPPEVADTVENMGGDVVLTGDAVHSATTGLVTLTADEKNEAGAVFSNQRIDLNSDFDISFNVYLGDGDGADGMAFVFHDSQDGADSIGGGGGSLGAFGIDDGLALEFDTHQNKRKPYFGDIKNDHASWVDTDTGVTAGGTGLLNLGNVEDGNWHSVSVSWDADSQELSYVFDGEQGDTLSGDIAGMFFGDSDFVYFGFTGATGGKTNLHQVQVLGMDATLEDGTEIAVGSEFAQA